MRVTCLYHSKCTFVLPLHKDPGDDARKLWLTEVPKNTRSDSKDEKDAKRTEHLRLAQRFRT